MYTSNSVLGASTVVGGAGAVAVLPHTGSLRPLFVAGVVTTALGVVMLVAAGVAMLRQRASKVQG
jgi:hypothetical protein